MHKIRQELLSSYEYALSLCKLQAKNIVCRCGADYCEIDGHHHHCKTNQEGKP